MLHDLGGRLVGLAIDFVRAFAGCFFVLAGVGFDVFGEAEFAELVVGEIFGRTCFGMITDNGGGLRDALDRLTGGGMMGERVVRHALRDFKNLSRLVAIENDLVNVGRHINIIGSVWLSGESGREVLAG